MKFRIISESGAFVARDPTIVRLDLGPDTSTSKAFAIRAPVCELLPQYTEIEGSHLQPGPHLEALDHEAEMAMAEYWRQHPGASLDPTRSLPLQGGFDDLVQGQLNRLLAGSGIEAKPQDDELTALRHEVAELRAMLLAAAPKAPTTGRRAAT